MVLSFGHVLLLWAGFALALSQWFPEGFSFTGYKPRKRRKYMNKKISIVIIMIVVCLSMLLIALGTFAARPAQRNDFEIIAHRGVHQDYASSSKGIRWNNSYLTECTASRIYRPTHDYLENTVESIQAAFDYGATMVEIDIRPTRDNQLVVFHDWMLECRTNGRGNVKDHTVDYLKTLDIGYGYTCDGKTYPFRGKVVGKIRTLTEIVRAFPEKKFLLDNKNGNDLKTAQLIADTLSRFPKKQQKLLYLWCEDGAFDYIHRRLPLITRLILPRNQQKIFYKSYLLRLGFGHIPERYKHQGIGLPTHYTKYIWGWPNRFLGKVYDADMRFYLYLNTVEEARHYSDLPLNGIVTDHIEVLGNIFK
jgi:glycerophosphoryl diester phosphodiesterase